MTRSAFGSLVRAALIALAIASHHSALAAQAATEGPPPADSLGALDFAPGTPGQPHARWALLREDRVRHFSLSFALGMGVGLATNNADAAGAVPAGLGLAKELDDARRPSGFDGWDLLADVLGASLAAWAISALDR